MGVVGALAPTPSRLRRLASQARVADRRRLGFGQGICDNRFELRWRGRALPDAYAASRPSMQRHGTTLAEENHRVTLSERLGEATERARGFGRALLATLRRGAGADSAPREGVDCTSIGRGVVGRPKGTQWV